MTERQPSIRVVGIRLDDRREATIYANAYGVDIDWVNTSVRYPTDVKVFVDGVYIGTLDVLPYFGYVGTLRLSWTSVTNETLILHLYDSPFHRKNRTTNTVVARILSITSGTLTWLMAYKCLDLMISYPVKALLQDGTIVDQSAGDPIFLTLGSPASHSNSIVMNPGDSISLKDIRPSLFALSAPPRDPPITIYINFLCVRWI